MRLIQLSRALVVAVLAGGSVSALAQAVDPAQPAQPGQAQPGGGRGNFDPAQFRQRMLDRYKTALGASDEEWQALSPQVQKVLDAQRATRSGGNFGGRQRGGNNGQPATAAPTDPNAQPNPVADKAKELQTAIDNKDTKPEELKAKLAALRDARAKAKESLLAAQKDLQALLTQRQEATLVQMGLLD